MKMPLKVLWDRLGIASKTFLAVLALFILIQMITIFAIWHFESRILLHKERQLLHNQLHRQKRQLEHHMTALAKETRFLASLEVMDDLIGKDIDKRIATLLKRRAEDLGEGIILVARAGDTFVASSKKGFTATLSAQKNGKLSPRYLYFYAPVFASFEKKKRIGSIVMLYPLRNLTALHADSTEKNLWITPPVPHPLFKEKNLHDSIVVTQQLTGILQGWTLHLAYDKEHALMTLRHVQMILVTTFLFAILLLAGIMMILSHKLTRPLKELTETVQEITRTQDFTTRVHIDSEDEIATLSHAFNTLLSRTQNLIDTIRKQTALHRDQLIRLIAFFNALIETKTHKETIDTALKHIGSFFSGVDIRFIQNAASQTGEATIPVTYYHYKRHREVRLGTIVMQSPPGQRIDRELFASMAQMIRLQLEHIQLLHDTKEALEAKSTFLATMSHELRTPLGSILNLIQHLALAPKIDEEGRRMLGAIETSAQHLLAMINNILQLSKLESNSIIPLKEHVNLEETLAELTEIMEPLITDKGIALITDIDLPDKVISTDPNLLKQVMINLLSNAVKFTDRGTIKVSLYAEGERYLFRVRDSGIGIEKSRQKNLFQLFYQAHTDSTRVRDSSGLGLALSQKVAKLLGGKITIFSEGVNKGTTATFTFTSI